MTKADDDRFAASIAPHPRWNPDKPGERHPKTVGEWNWRNDAFPASRERSQRRLAVAADYSDPRAPDQMAVVLRVDLIRIMGDYVRLRAWQEFMREKAQAEPLPILSREEAVSALTASAERDRLGVSEVVRETGGYWRPCSGCHDTEDGHPTASYPHSLIFGCEQGSGCSECGGLGVLWDDLSYVDDMVEEMLADEAPTAGKRVAHRFRFASDILEGMTDGIDGDRLGALIRWTRDGAVAADEREALERIFAAPWLAAEDEAGWVGDARAEAAKDIARITADAEALS